MAGHQGGLLPAILLVGAGGAAGSVMRFLLGLLMARLSGGGFWQGTLAANGAGCFLMGLAFVWLAGRGAGPAPQAFLMAGVLGGFTTFSAFALDSWRIRAAGHDIAWLLYVAATVALSLLAFAAGAALAGRILAWRARG